MNSPKLVNNNKKADWVWLIMSNDDLMKWLVLMEDRQQYEKCAEIWNELDRRLGLLPANITKDLNK